MNLLKAKISYYTTTLNNVILVERCFIGVMSMTCVLQYVVVCWVTVGEPPLTYPNGPALPGIHMGEIHSVQIIILIWLLSFCIFSIGMSMRMKREKAYKLNNFAQLQFLRVFRISCENKIVNCASQSPFL
jgi:hypothetical protein